MIRRSDVDHVNITVRATCSIKSFNTCPDLIEQVLWLDIIFKKLMKTWNCEPFSISGVKSAPGMCSFVLTTDGSCEARLKHLVLPSMDVHKAKKTQCCDASILEDFMLNFKSVILDMSILFHGQAKDKNML
jgi:hypothetical protein